MSVNPRYKISTSAVIIISSNHGQFSKANFMAMGMRLSLISLFKCGTLKYFYLLQTSMTIGLMYVQPA